MDMAATPTIRTVALVGHSGVGKTTLAEALLHRAGLDLVARCHGHRSAGSHHPQQPLVTGQPSLGGPRLSPGRGVGRRPPRDHRSRTQLSPHHPSAVTRPRI